MNKQKKNATLSMGNHSFILTLSLCLLLGYFLIQIISINIQAKERKEVLNAKEAAYQQQIAENEQKQAVVENPDKSEYMEKIARELGYGMPGEKVFYCD